MPMGGVVSKIPLEIQSLHHNQAESLGLPGIGDENTLYDYCLIVCCEALIEW